ncbi:MAG: AAA family ATPase [bacterium]
MQKLPLGIQTFSEIRKETYLYVDKTQYLYELITGGKVYFLSRPRRFGKSLLLSTLDSLFRGEKKLFKGLWIYDKWDFERFPVISLSMSLTLADTPTIFRDSLCNLIRKTADIHKLFLEGSNYKDLFSDLIYKLAREKRVVVLIDEYDKPIIDHLKNKETAVENREVLKNFYSVLKDLDEYIRFIFLTGVSKFSKTSVFSGLNNLRDLTVEEKYSEMLGYTAGEMDIYFSGYITSLSKKLEMDREDLMRTIAEWFNGYSWDSKHKVYNPFSILSLFLKEEFNNYWFSTGTPNFLIDLIREREFELPHLENLLAGDDLLDSFNVEQMSIEALLFQTGYLTVKGIERRGVRKFYKLGYPNIEVKESFLNHLVASYTGKPIGISDMLFYTMGDDLENEDIPHFFEKMEGIIAGIPYNLIVEREAYYSSLIYTILALVGIRAEFEVQTAKGRLDAQIEFKEKIYLFEFKYDRPAEEAIEQIIEMRYFDRHKGKGKDVILIGVGFKRKEKLFEFVSERWGFST